MVQGAFVELIVTIAKFSSLHVSDLNQFVLRTNWILVHCTGVLGSTWYSEYYSTYVRHCTVLEYYSATVVTKNRTRRVYTVYCRIGLWT